MIISKKNFNGKTFVVSKICENHKTSLSNILSYAVFLYTDIFYTCMYIRICICTFQLKSQMLCKLTGLQINTTSATLPGTIGIITYINIIICILYIAIVGT